MKNKFNWELNEEGVVIDTYNHEYFKIGDIVSLYKDDNTVSPLFLNKRTGKTYYLNYNRIQKIKCNSSSLKVEAKIIPVKFI